MATKADDFYHGLSVGTQHARRIRHRLEEIAAALHIPRHLSAELGQDARYRRAWKAALEQSCQRERALVKQMLGRPITLGGLADRALVADLCGDADEDAHQLVAAAAELARLPVEWPWQGRTWRVGTPPPEAEAMIRKLLGRHRPKRRAMPRAEAERIAPAAGAEAVAKAAAAIKAKPADAPLFAKGRST